MGGNQARLEDIGQSRIEALDAAGIDVSILSVVTPATQALPARQAVRLQSPAPLTSEESRLSRPRLTALLRADALL
jgi:hypothetical protein